MNEVFMAFPILLIKIHGLHKQVRTVIFCLKEALVHRRNFHLLSHFWPEARDPQSPSAL